MSFRWERVHLWSCEVADEAGGVARKLAALAEGGTNLGYVSTRRLPERPGAGVLYVAPITGAEPVRAAKAIGLHEVQLPVVIKLEGDNVAGLAFRLTTAWAKAGISFSGLSLSVVNAHFIGHAAFDSAADANRAATILAEIGKP